MKQSKLTISASLFAAVFTLGLAFSATSQAAGPGATPRKKQTRMAYRAELDALIKEHMVPCKISLDCEALPLGVKACGGPSEYLVLSKGTRSKMQDALTDLSKTINEMDTTANEGMMGTCEAMVKPEVACASGNCVRAALK